MSTIAPSRDSSLQGRRIPSLATPTSSARPSFDSLNGRSASASPNRGSQPSLRRNRTALREYYNLKKEENQKLEGAQEKLQGHLHNDISVSEVRPSQMDKKDFDGEAYAKHVLETQSLGQLLKTYNGILTDIRALDAEKKALVYDNYSKLITATETIRKMRSNMDPLNPMASTLDPAIASIYERAAQIKSELRSSMTPAQRAKAELSALDREKLARKLKSKALVNQILDTPQRLRILVAEGKVDEAKVEWKGPEEILMRWKEEGRGGVDVQDCIDDGEAALRGEAPNEKSWVMAKVKMLEKTREV